MSSLLQLLAPIGWIFNSFFYGPVFNVLMLIYHVTNSFALSVVVVTLLLRTCLIPLTRKQLKSSREMQVLQPKLKELQQRYRGNPQQLMEEQRRLYKEHGVSPMSGCLPLLVQMPVLYALYGSFLTIVPRSGKATLHSINANIYPFLPHLSRIPDLHFLFLNLGVPDPTHLLPILAAVLTFVQLRMAMPVRQKQPGTQSDSMTQATGMMQWMMPIMTLFIGLNFAAGLAMYWCISTGFSVVQQYFINGRNFGSLFLTATTAGSAALAGRPASNVRGQPAGSRFNAGGASTTAAPDAPQATGGLRGMWRQMREALAAQQAAALAPAQSGEARVVEGSISDAGPNNSTESLRPSRPDRRPRPRGGGATLVRPPSSSDTSDQTPTGGETETGETTSPDATAEAIRAATDTSVLPERAVARDAGGADDLLRNTRRAAAGKATSSGARTSAPAQATRPAVANGKVSPPAANGKTPGVNGAQRSAGARNGSSPRAAHSTGPARTSSGQRKPAAKGQSGARSRTSRPKGGK